MLFCLKLYAFENKELDYSISSLLTTFQNDSIIQEDNIQLLNETYEPNDTINTIETTGRPEVEPLDDGEEDETIDMQEPERIRGSAVILEDRVIYSCVDSIDFDFRMQRVFLYGDADVKYQNIHLIADYVEISFKDNELFASGWPDSLGVIRGYPVFTEGPQSFESEEIRYNFETKKGRTLNVITEEAEGFLHGDVVKIMPDKVIHISEGKFTTCDQADPHFHIGFRRAKVIPDDKIVTSFAYLKINDIPTPLFVPFGFFPNTKGQASGVLIPSYGEARNRGFYLENGGFYWGINDYLDLAIRGSIFSRGSWGLDLSSRYNVRYKYNGSLNIVHATTVLGEENLPDYEKSQDFRIVWNHSQDPKARPNSSFSANVNAGTSQMSRYSPASDQDYLSNSLSSNVSYSANWAGMYNFSANLRHNQNTISQAVDLSLPEIAFSVSRFYPLRKKTRAGEYKWYENITMSYNLNVQNKISTVDTLLFREETLSEFENGIRHAIPISHSTNIFSHFNLTNSFNYNERWYFESVEKSWNYDDRENYTIVTEDENGRLVTDTIYGQVRTDTIPGFRSVRDFSYNTSISTRIYGMAQFKRTPLNAIRHVITPSLGMSFRPDFGDEFWGYYKEFYNPVQDKYQSYSVFETGIYGGPPRGRQGSVNFSISNNLEIKVRSRKDTISGERKIALIDRFTISSAYDLAMDSLNLADLRMAGSTRLFGNFDVTYAGTWTPYAVDDDGRKINQFLWDTDGKLLHLTNTSWNLSFNYNLQSKSVSERSNGANSVQGGINGSGGISGDIENGEQDSETTVVRRRDANGHLQYEEIDYSVPWSLRFSYTFQYNSRSFMHENRTDRDYIQNLRVSGDVKLTDNWRIGFQSGYDFDRNEITYTSIDIHRDLHCWEMTFNWIPFGFRQSYNFTIRVKAAVLQDLKYTRRTHHLDAIN